MAAGPGNTGFGLQVVEQARNVLPTEFFIHCADSVAAQLLLPANIILKRFRLGIDAEADNMNFHGAPACGNLKPRNQSQSGGIFNSEQFSKQSWSVMARWVTLLATARSSKN